MAVNCWFVLTGIEAPAGERVIAVKFAAALVTLRVAVPCIPPD